MTVQTAHRGRCRPPTGHFWAPNLCALLDTKAVRHRITKTDFFTPLMVQSQVGTWQGERHT